MQPGPNLGVKNMTTKTPTTSDLDLEEATKIIVLHRISREHDHIMEDELCEECKAVCRKMNEYSSRHGMRWHFLLSEARGYFQGFKDARNQKNKDKG